MSHPARAQAGRTPAAEDASVQLDTLSVEGTGTARGVVPAYAGGQVAQGGRLGLLGNAETKKSPFSVSSYTDRFIRDRQASTASEALALDPSVRATQTTGAPFDSFYIRGFPINEGTSGEFAFDGVYGVAPSFRVFTDYAERIEVLKGPSAALSGVAPNGGVGGVINVVPKRAGEDLTRFTLDYGSAARGGGGFDIARRYGANREWGARIVGSLRGGDTPIDRQSETTGVGALALDYRGERFRAWLYLLAQKDRFDAPLRPFLLRAGVPVPRAPDGSRNLTQPWEYSDIDDRGGLLRLEYDLADQVTLFGDVGGSRTGVERYFASAPTITNLRGDTTTAPQFYSLGVDRLTVDGGVRARFDTGFVRHAFVVQASRYDEDTARRLPAANGSYLSNIYAPVLAPFIAPTVIDSRPRLSDSTLTGVSVADTLSVFDERILLTLGVRRQGIEAHNYVSNVGTLASSYDKSATSPLVGIVVRPWENVSLYGNYIEGLSRGDIAPVTATNAGEILAPYVAHQVEAGVRVDWGTLATTFSAFEITRPIGELSPTRRFAQTGEQRVSGLEFSAYGEITPGLRVLGGATLLDGVLTRTEVAANVGHVPIGVPGVQLNLGAEWDLPWVPGFALNGAVVYTGRQFVDAANTQPLPDWTRLDLGARYTTTIEGRRTTIRANVVNVTGANYWTGVASFGTFFQGAPRTYLLSMAVDL
ncbi:MULTISPECIES: TonB-dependent siderophore receptor [Methylobacterium]|uniref:Ferrichrome receptor FcuA n=8 Tax=Pseudomonadota TaxID=1224 RepID=A0ABQ4SZ71_9HYPH|nr:MULTISPECIES: TonB-dependent siderophore receptor [Methylobacterium]GBU18834.1 ferrichrome iron receptor precursor [Methylobacterium sp.]GJE06951.1 Ferrichrome receptor FcuA [Methylobacterium jeotgali]